MAVGSGSASGKKRSVNSPRHLQKKEVDSQENHSSPLKRNKCPPVRVVGSRIYDPVNGKTCHQCRQKTRDFSAACKTLLDNDKLCPIMYCHKCLLNRYGEKAEEVAAIGEWSCPKCRGICNCSICMKKRGQQPTGLLISTAKSIGYSSVSEMLLKGGVGQFSKQRKVEPVVGSPKKVDAASPKKHGKMISVDANLPKVDKKSKEKKRPRLEKTSSDGDDKKMEKTKKIKLKKGMDAKLMSRKSPRKLPVTNEEANMIKAVKKLKTRKEDDSNTTDAALTRRTSPRKLPLGNKIPNEEAHVIKKDKADASNGDIVCKKIVDLYAEIPLPMGTELTSVSKVDIPADDVGNALQFLEFCAAFGEILDMHKGQGEYVLQDLLHGRTGRRGKISATVNFHILLLSILQEEETEGEALNPTKWFDALKKHFSESQSVLKAECLDALEKASDYETLKASEKLSLLNILCDEILATEKVRTWMDEQNTKVTEKVKEAKHKVAAARQMEKSLKQKMRDDLAKAIVSKNGEPLSISEHEAIITQIKSETEEAHARVLVSQGNLLENIWSCDAVRIKPVFMGSGGNVYWKLKCSRNYDLLRQNLVGGDAPTLKEKWFAIDDEGKQMIEKHICSSWGRAKRSKMVDFKKTD